MKPLKTSITDQIAGSLTKYVSLDKLGVPFARIMEETKKIVAHDLVTGDKKIVSFDKDLRKIEK